MNGGRIAYAGMTHLGLISGAAAAARGFETLCFDADPGRIAALERGELPVIEPGLVELLREHRPRLRFSADPGALTDSDVAFVAPDVPTDDRGQSDLRPLDALLATIAGAIRRDATLVILSQVPPGFTRARQSAGRPLHYQVETLVFGRAVERALRPERFILGCADPGAPLPTAYGEFLAAFDCPILKMRLESAELAKIAINLCLAASVSVANTLAGLAEQIGADFGEVAPALKLDRRIGPYAYLAPGLGLAGGNIERDLATLQRLAWETGSEMGLVEAIGRNSQFRADWVLRVLHREVFSRRPRAAIGILGLAYKEDTHSTKNSASLGLIRHLSGASLALHDPVVPVSAAAHPKARAAASPLDAATDVDALVIMTPWAEYRALDPAALARRMAGRVLIDPYRVIAADRAVAAGLHYHALGMPALRSPGGADA